MLNKYISRCYRHSRDSDIVAKSVRCRCREKVSSKLTGCQSSLELLSVGVDSNDAALGVDQKRA